FQGYPDITVHQPQTVVITGDHDRATGEPAFPGTDQLVFAQGGNNCLVQPLDPERATAQGAQQLEAVIGLQNLAGPLLPLGPVGIRSGSRPLHYPQVVAVTFRRCHRPALDQPSLAATGET